MPGTKINPRLAALGGSFLVLVVMGALLWPYLGSTKAPIPTIEPTHFKEPQQPPIELPKQIMAPSPVPTAIPQARPTPCEPCVEAANEVLRRYLTAIRTGAGPDNRDDHHNVYEAPSLYPMAHPVYSPPAADVYPLHSQRQQ